MRGWRMFEAQPPPPPQVIEYRLVVKCCPGCGAVTGGTAPEGVASLVQYGPGVHAKAALAVCAHYLPVARATKLVAAYTGVTVPVGFMAGMRQQRRNKATGAPEPGHTATSANARPRRHTQRRSPPQFCRYDTGSSVGNPW